MVRLSTLGLLASTIAFAAADSSTAATCGGGSKCPASLPCCSQYGQCGVGAYCLGGCDPGNSNTLDACVPEPVCQNKALTFGSIDNITPNTKYLGDSTKADWVSDGTPTPYQGNVLLTMAQGTVGTLLASSDYVWYGKVSATIKTSRAQGVVTAFILLSDVKDEIDFEFVGADLSHAQTNYYYQGITNYDHGGNISLSDTFQNYHTYTIDWTPDQITWSIDGQVGRTLKKSDTFNKTTNQYYYPQTPSRVQLSLWPAGLSSNGQGTIDWAGGLINWNSDDIKNNGYYYAVVKDVSINCYNPPSDAQVNGKTSYVFTNNNLTESSVSITDKGTVIKSLLGTGTNLTAGDTSSASSATASNPASVPGLSGAGTGGTSSQHGTDNNQGGTSNSDSTKSSSAAVPTGTGFSQGSKSAGSGTKSDASALGKQQGEKVLRGSLFAGLVAVGGVLLL